MCACVCVLAALCLLCVLLCGAILKFACVGYVVCGVLCAVVCGVGGFQFLKSVVRLFI